MNSTAQLARDPQAQLPTGPTHVAARTRTSAPGAWKPTDRWDWACGLPVSGIGRTVANCIARHANDKTGRCWPGMGTIATETGFCRRAVVKAIKELERGGHVTVSRFKVGKKNRANRYQLPPMGSAPDALGGSAPDALGGSAPDALGGSAPDALGGSAPDALGGSAPDALGGSAPDALGGSAPDALGGSAPDALGGSAPDALGGSAPDALGGSAPDALGGSAPDALGGSAPDALGGSAPDALPSAPHALGGSAPGAPESVSNESVHESVSSSRARVVCKICKHDWPDKAEYGSTCYKCGHNPSTRKPNADTPAQELTQELAQASCTCGDAYRNSYQRRCVDCDGTPSFAQMDALKEAMSKGKA